MSWETYAKAPVVGVTLYPGRRPQESPRSAPSKPQVQQIWDLTNICLLTCEYATSYSPLEGGVISIVSIMDFVLRSTLKREGRSMSVMYPTSPRVLSITDFPLDERPSSSARALTRMSVSISPLGLEAERTSKFVWIVLFSTISVQRTQISSRRGWYSKLLGLWQDSNVPTIDPVLMSKRSIVGMPRLTAAQTYFFPSEIISENRQY
mmetsp:Transcript_24099/g.33879  ORF Transcript_24099/g.33879 Transcript_24099/m.33879 type:complete len:207 (+) Transcript_24099:269-889(+)